MALFKDSDFERIHIPIFSKDIVKDDTVIQIFGELNPSQSSVIKYVALMYDHNSPMRNKIPDISERKEECAEVAGLKSGREKIFDLSDDNVVGYINTYLRYQSSKLWAILAANEEVLWQYQQELLTPITNYKNDKDKLQALEMKSKLMQECDAIVKRIESYEQKIFGDNFERKEDILAFTPESIANI